MNQAKQLPVPDIVLSDPNSIELLRVWAANGNQCVSVNAELWKDPASWGIMLVDLAKHIANAYGKSNLYDSSAALHRIKQGFDVEWNSPTDSSS
jgi:hypothetical protein